MQVEQLIKPGTGKPRNEAHFLDVSVGDGNELAQVLGFVATFEQFPGHKGRRCDSVRF